MSVSLTTVQAAAQGLTPNNASGPLTLNVLHKTDVLLTQLLALNPSKPHSIEVLKGAPNGLAEVQIGQLKLDVKASLPLKAGEVFQLKIEQHGEAIRFVQPASVGGGGAERASVVPKGQTTLPGAQALQGNGLAPGQNGLQAASAGKGLGGVSQTLQTGAPVSGQGAQAPAGQNALTASSRPLGAPQGGSQNAILTQGTPSGTPAGTPTGTPATTPSHLPNGTPPGAPAQTLSHTPSGVPHQAGLGAGGAQPLSPVSGIQAQAANGAVLQAIAEVLPQIAKKDGQRGDLSKSEIKSLARSYGSHSEPGARLAAGSVGGSPRVDQVNAKYKQFSSSPIDEIKEIQGKPLQRAADLTLEIPVNAADKPVVVQLYIDPDAASKSAQDDDKRYGLRFSLETEDTGPVHAEIGLRASQIRVVIWAEREDFATRLMDNRAMLDDRLAAVGLDLSAVVIRRGSPPKSRYALQSHVDEQI